MPRARGISVNRVDDEDSYSSNNSELGIDNICVNIDNYLDEVEKSLHAKSRIVVNHSEPSSQGTSGSSLTEESKISSTLSREGSTSNPFVRHHRTDLLTPRKEYVTAIQIPSPVISAAIDSEIGSISRSVTSEEPAIQLIWRNLSYQAKQNSLFSIGSKSNRKKILSKQNGGITGGQITAIIGPSGAGKSTLLECLAGRRVIGLKGEIYVVFDKSLSTGKRSQGIKISLIGQKDEAIKTLTVREVLQFASQIKNYRKNNNKYYTPRLVEAVLQELSLEKCANVKVSRISGGQLKRLVFGVELISGPDIILLDEPTSGYVFVLSLFHFSIILR